MFVEVSFQCCFLGGLSDTNTLSECHQVLLHNQTLYDAREYNAHDKWVPVTIAWHILSLKMEEQPPIWSVAVNTLNKQSWTADNVWPSSLGVRHGANKSSP
jgi:hypothetical protein